MSAIRNSLGGLRLMALGSCLAGTALAQDSELIGAWKCAGTAEDPEMGMTTVVEFVQTYAADKTYERTANLNITIAAFTIDLTMVVRDTGTWSRDAMAVTEVMSGIDIRSSNDTPSQAEQVMLQLIQDEAEADIGTEEIMRIRSLTATTMEVDDGGGLVLECARA